MRQGVPLEICTNAALPVAEPPGWLSAAVVAFDRTVREDCPSWFESQGLIADLDRWQSLARDAGSFWGFATTT